MSYGRRIAEYQLEENNANRGHACADSELPETKMKTKIQQKDRRNKFPSIAHNTSRRRRTARATYHGSVILYDA